MTTTETVVPRRDRLRAATEAEIRATARRLLVAEKGQPPTLRGIAREMGMTAPGLYRYYASLDDLLLALCDDLFGEVHGVVTSALEEHGDDLGARMLAAVRAFRGWALAHPAEFGLMFRSGDGLWADGEDGCEQSRRFAALFLELFVGLWAARPFPLPELHGGVAASCGQLATFARTAGVDLPEPALWVFANGWVRLYGVVCMEALGHLRFMFSDVEPYFEAELEQVARTIGVTYAPPVPAGRR
ncbi:TetR/AcrR family transcriptional regulator [Cellulomonas sp. NS3]|uniref:TetR/AcrR family transcriptional regulator n=1 Tax=Cellulomonas sp. NS3 TaxID=2973977 RepID=UPI002162646B|nr:TetR/AcrR family transcriptional regulator [Cellulomonas sp. NS3]